MAGIVRRRFLQKKERKVLLQDISKTFGIDVEKAFGAKPQIEVIETSKHRIYALNAVPLFARSEEDFFPTLSFKEHFSFLPKITVDMGAIPYVCNGADVMAPGVAEIQGDFKEKELVVILDERNRRPIAIARSIFDSETTKTLKKGRTFKNLHHVGDDVWNIIKGH